MLEIGIFQNTGATVALTETATIWLKAWRQLADLYILPRIFSEDMSDSMEILE